MNEWKLQKDLTKRWVKHGVVVDGEKLFLAAWEVMSDDWGINDSKRDWQQTSVDFLFCDKRGGLWVMEVKNEIHGVRDFESTLCQVTHRAAMLKHSYLYERLALAFFETRSGIHGRVKCDIQDDFRRTHRRFFGLRHALPKSMFNKKEIRRVIAAREYCDAFYPVLRGFCHAEPHRLFQRLKRDYRSCWKNKKEFARLTALDAAEIKHFTRQVYYVRLEDELAER